MASPDLFRNSVALRSIFVRGPHRGKLQMLRVPAVFRQNTCASRDGWFALPKPNPNSASDLCEKVRNRIQALDTILSADRYISFDPYDGLLSPLGKMFAQDSKLRQQIWVQTIRRTPFNMRRVLGVTKMAHTKTLSDASSAYSLLFARWGDPMHKQKAIDALSRLLDIGLETPAGSGWGLRFPYVSRFGKTAVLEPNAFNTINAIHALLDGYSALHESRYLENAIKGFAFLRTDLGYEDCDEGIAWRYTKHTDARVFNISGLMIGLTARMGTLLGDHSFFNYTHRLYAFLRGAENMDGSWHYADDPRGAFIDGFHSGFILEGVLRAIEGGVLEKDGALDKACAYYLSTFFVRSGLPRYFSHSLYPVDSQNCAQSLQTLVFMNRLGLVSKDFVDRCFNAIDSALWNLRGYYNHRRTPHWTYRTPMHKWATGPMFLALAHMICI
jgi:hypothetical protein